MTSLHQVVKGTFTLELSNMLGTQKSAHCAEDGAVGVTSREGVKGTSIKARAWQTLID
jgi:hypothetical protein